MDRGAKTGEMRARTEQCRGCRAPPGGWEGAKQRFSPRALGRGTVADTSVTEIWPPEL